MQDDNGDEPGRVPRLGERGAEARSERERRRAEAMRANLRRRKQQARGREAGSTGRPNPVEAEPG